MLNRGLIVSCQACENEPLYGYGIMNLMAKAAVAGDGETAFRAAHTLKGIALNLGFDSLYKADFDLTEKLRGRSTDGCEEFFAATKKAYESLYEDLKKVKESV